MSLLIKFIVLLFIIYDMIDAKPITVSPLFQYSLQAIQNRITAKLLPEKQSFELWVSYFQSHAKTGSIGHEKQNIASLIFGAPTWQIQDFIPNIPEQNPLLFLTYTPRCKLKRKAALVEFRYRRKIIKNTYFFLRAKTSIYQNTIKVKTYGNEFSPETATSDDLFQTSENGFTYRFDALSNLPLTSTGPGSQIPFVNFFDQTFQQPGISMRGLLVTDAPLANTPVIVQKATPTQPPLQTSIEQPGAQALPVLGLQETLSQNQMRRFATLVDYTPVKTQTDLNLLWILPTTVQNELSQNAAKIQAAVQQLIANQTFNSTNAILESVGIDLVPKKNTGFGGILLEPGFEFHISTHCIQNVYGIIILPAEHTVSGGDVFKIPLGNNGHGAVGVGFTTIASVADPIIISLDAGYFYTIGKTEKMALPLAKSNLSVGPVVDARPSWHTVYINPNVSLTCHYKEIDALFAVDYCAYFASSDHISTPRLFYPEKSVFAIDRKKKISQQQLQTVSVTGSFTYNTTKCALNFLLTITRTVQAHNALFEKGWSMTCGITF